MEVRIALPADRSAILALYECCGYRGGFSDADEILVATNRAELVGVVRLCEENGTAVLRGMQVHPDRRRRGIGSMLLDGCGPALGTRPCFCLPYDHLTEFYGQVGFRRADERELPAFLLERLRSYRNTGLAVVPMLRAPLVRVDRRPP